MNLTLPNKSFETLVLGGVPRVHLLPKEVAERRKSLAIRRGLLTGLGAAVVLVVIGVAVASFGLATANSNQSSEQSKTALVLTQLSKFSAVTTVQGQVDDVKTTQPVATQGEILWAPYIASLQTTLPAGVSITAFVAKLDAPVAAVPAGTATNPLIGNHVATLSVTAVGTQSSVTDWLLHVTALKGIVNATPGAVALSPITKLYTVNVDLLVSDVVLAHRFSEGSK
jgi:uncharacterized membrane protein YidH (DUF202 family)